MLNGLLIDLYNKIQCEVLTSHLFPSDGQLGVSPDASLHVVVALSMATQVDGVGVHVDVHEVVDYLTLDVVLHPVHQETAAYVDDLDEGQVSVGTKGKGQLGQQKVTGYSSRYVEVI